MKKKELFAYIEALDFLLVETNKRLRKLEEQVEILSNIEIVKVWQEELSKPVPTYNGKGDE